MILVVLNVALKTFLAHDKEGLERMLLLPCCEDGLLLFPIVSNTKIIDLKKYLFIYYFILK